MAKNWIKLYAITKDYINRISLRKQPYLVYEHQDAGHPHVYIITKKHGFSRKEVLCLK